MRLLWSNDVLRVDSSNSREGSNMVPRSPDEKAVPRSEGEKSLVSQFEIVAEAFLKLFELLEEYAPVWYTEQHHQRTLTAWRILQANPWHVLGTSAAGLRKGS